MRWLVLCLCLLATPASAATLTVTLTASEPVIVAGTPRIAIDVGGVTRYATYTGSTGAPLTSLPFSYAVQAGDFDADGIDVTPQVDLNGATLADRAGNPLTALTFTKPNTAALKVQTYTASFTSTVDPTAVSFTITKAPVEGSFSYTIASSGGSAMATGSGTIGSSSHTVSGVDVSALPSGTLTLSVTVSNASGSGSARTASFVPGFTGILDSLPTAAAAYSVRRLRGAYTGPALRVRRSTDNVEQDIGFTVAGDLDQAKLTSFCGSATCYVTIWNDQSSSGWNQVQTAASAQPRVTNAGSLELHGNRTGVRFYGAQRLASVGFPSSSNEFTICLAAIEINRKTNDTWVMFDLRKRVLAYMPDDVGILSFDVAGINRPYHLQATWPLATSEPAVVSFQNSASQVTRSVFLNGSLLLSGNGYAAPADQLTLGSNYDGMFTEFVLFTSSLDSSARHALERSEGSYFGVTVP